MELDLNVHGKLIDVALVAVGLMDLIRIAVLGTSYSFAELIQPWLPIVCSQLFLN
jgi:hypothetical protein